MKKQLISALLASTVVFTAVSCGNADKAGKSSFADATEVATSRAEDYFAKHEGYENFADLNSVYTSSSENTSVHEIEYKASADAEKTTTGEFSVKTVNSTEQTVNVKTINEVVFVTVKTRTTETETGKETDEDGVLKDYSDKTDTSTSYYLGKIGEDFCCLYEYNRTENDVEVTSDTVKTVYKFVDEYAYEYAVNYLINKFSAKAVSKSYFAAAGLDTLMFSLLGADIFNVKKNGDFVTVSLEKEFSIANASFYSSLNIPTTPTEDPEDLDKLNASVGTMKINYSLALSPTAFGEISSKMESSNKKGDESFVSTEKLNIGTTADIAVLENVEGYTVMTYAPNLDNISFKSIGFVDILGS